MSRSIPFYPPNRASSTGPDELDTCTLLLDADTKDDLKRQVQDLKVHVGPLAQDPATDTREQRQIHDLLRALIAARQLVPPVRLYKREAPDFVLETGDKRIGIEARLVVNPDYMAAQKHPAAQRDDAVVDASLYKWGTHGRPQFQIREEAGRTRLSGLPWMDDDVEQEFAQSVKDTVLEKHYKLCSHYARFDMDILLIYHYQPSPLIDIDKARVYTSNTLIDYWDQCGFDAVYVHKYNWMLRFAQGMSKVVYESPRSNAPFFIETDIWESLRDTEKIYLKLLEEEPDFISSTYSPDEREGELENLFGFESDLQALRMEWIVNRNRSLKRSGCNGLLHPPDLIRLRTASEIAACRDAFDLFCGGVLEHVFRAVSEWTDEGTITRLHKEMANRETEFVASVTVILRYLAGFSDIAHWASDAWRCSEVLKAIDPGN